MRNADQEPEEQESADSGRDERYEIDRRDTDRILHEKPLRHSKISDRPCERDPHHDHRDIHRQQIIHENDHEHREKPEVENGLDPRRYVRKREYIKPDKREQDADRHLHRRILPRYFLLAVPALRAQDQKTQHRNIVIPRDLPLAFRAVRSPEKRLVRLQTTNHHVQKTSDNDAEQKKEEGYHIDAVYLFSKRASKKPQTIRGLVLDDCQSNITRQSGQRDITANRKSYH